jgi:hypothetical protein
MAAWRVTQFNWAAFGPCIVIDFSTSGHNGAVLHGTGEGRNAPLPINSLT